MKISALTGDVGMLECDRHVGVGWACWSGVSGCIFKPRSHVGVEGGMELRVES